jgi:putative ABC transport system permease protein
MSGILEDIRSAFRGAARAPGTTALAVLALAVAMGASAAVFAAVNAALLRPLPYARASELVQVYETFPPGPTRGSVSLPNLREWERETTAFQGMAAYGVRARNLQRGDSAEQIPAAHVSANLFSLLGVAPLRGRTLVPDEDRQGHARVVILSERLWRGQFGADEAVIGQSVLIDTEPHTVVGVLPASFRFPMRAPSPDMWVSLQPTAQQTESRGYHWLSVVGRLRPGVSLESAQQELKLVAQRQAALHKGQEGRSVDLVSMREEVSGNVKGPMLLMLAAVLLVLLIACANVANLMLARASDRGRDVAVRVALGAGRGRLVRLFLVESLLLGATATALGLAFASVGVDALTTLIGDGLPGVTRLSFDGRVFAFCAMLCLATSVAFGLAPAAFALRVSPASVFKQASGRTTTGSHRWLRNGLVVGEVALTVVLLVGAGLLTRTFLSLRQVSAGFRADDILTGQVTLPRKKYDADEAARRFFQPALREVTSVPGVRRAAWTSALPMRSWGINGDFSVITQAVRPSESPLAHFSTVSPEYFQTLGIPLLSGRPFTEQDGPTSEPVAIINQELQRRYFGQSNPIGQKIVVNPSPLTIVGVVADIRQAGLATKPDPQIYRPYVQGPAGTDMSLVVDASVPPERLAGAIRGAVRVVDPGQSVAKVMPMGEVIAQSMGDRVTYLVLLATFALIAMLLAIIGVSSVMLYVVTMRTREIGIQSALGASPGRIRLSVIWEALRLGLLGVSVGLAVAVGGSQLLRTLVFGVEPIDALTYSAVSLVMLLTVVLSSYLPAWRATRVSPLLAMRYE